MMIMMKTYESPETYKMSKNQNMLSQTQSPNETTVYKNTLNLFYIGHLILGMKPTFKYN